MLTHFGRQTVSFPVGFFKNIDRNLNHLKAPFAVMMPARLGAEGWCTDSCQKHKEVTRIQGFQSVSGHWSVGTAA